MGEERASMMDCDVLKWVDQPEDPNIDLLISSVLFRSKIDRGNLNILKSTVVVQGFYEADTEADKASLLAILEFVRRKRCHK